MASMTYLQLSQRAARECGMSSSPSAVTSQTGEFQRLVDWVAAAWEEIQEKHKDWLWMRSRWSVNTSSGDDTYAGTDCTDDIDSATVSRFSHWWTHDARGKPNVKIYKSSDGVGTERWMSWMPWDDFRAVYKIGTQNNGAPVHYTVDPQLNLVLGPKPDGTYVTSGEYQKGVQTFTADATTPDMPGKFHLLIVYRTMEKYGSFKSAAGVFARGVRDGNRLMRQLELQQRPVVRTAGPMA